MVMSMVLALAAAVTAAAPTATQIEVPGPKGPLRGTLLMPAEKPKAVVLIVPGSGPTDRDGNNPMGIKAASYKMLAEGLAAQGVASARIDKRGMFGSAGAIPDPNAVTVADYARDIHDWAKTLRVRTGASCIWVLGHSEGGLVALAAAQKSANLCGLILVATPGRRLGDTLRAQLKANPANAPLLDQAFTAISALEAGRRVDTSNMHPALMPLFAPAVQGFVIDLLSYDPAKLAAALKLPVLIVQGEKDLQVSVEDARRLAAADPKAKLVLIPKANHVLKAIDSDDRAANAAAYGNPDLPLAPGIVEAITTFVTAPGRAAQPSK